MIRLSISGPHAFRPSTRRLATAIFAAALCLTFLQAPARATEVPFVKHTTDASFDGATSVYAADVDGDGDTDILGTAADDDDITWWENPGGAGATDGTAWPEHTIDGSFDGARSVHAADIDGDGDIDIAGAASFDYDIAWWENPGGTATTDGTAWAQHAIDLAFDGADTVHAADVDGDGDSDILGSAVEDNDITWWENPGGAATTDGTVWAEHTIDNSFAGADSVFTADMNGDGHTDILGAAQLDGDITWWENPGGAATTDGTAWTEHTIDGSFTAARSVHASDVDGDGDMDILGAAAAQAGDDVTWWENPGGVAATDGTPWVKRTIDGSFGGSAAVFAVDVDGDGDTDVLGAAATGEQIAWWENRTIHRNAVFPVIHILDESLDGVEMPYSADIDGDGDADILAASLNDDTIAWWANPGAAATTDGTPWTRHDIDDSFFGAASVHAADVDGDGDTDIVGSAINDDAVAWWENPGGAATTDGTPWSKYTLDDLFDTANSVFAADVDGDGDTDILGSAASGDVIAWWENPGGSSTTDPLAWTKHTIDAAFDGAYSVHAADVDGDGDVDILGAAVVDDDITWWENPGGAATTDGTPWAEHTVDGSFVETWSVFAEDMDGDGDPDILGSAFSDDTIAWWENPGGVATTDGTPWSKHTIDSSFDRPRRVSAADLDGDGDKDVYGAASTIDDDLVWWENPGGAATTDGTSWAKHVLGSRFVAAYAADVDGDGDMDLLATAIAIHQVAWWENRGGQFRLPTASLAPAAATSPGEQAVLQIDGVHNGRSGDTDVELVTFELLFDDGATPLTDSQANSIIENLRVYLDDGSGALDPADTLVDTVSTLSLTNGVQPFAFADGNTDGQVMFGTDRRYFVALDLLAGGLLDLVRVTHVTESSSTAEDRDHDIPLTLEFSHNVSATTIVEQDGVCPAEVIRANTTLGGTQSLQASVSATLGSNLVVDGDEIAVVAPVVSILGDTSISGPFSIGTSPSCP